LFYLRLSAFIRGSNFERGIAVSKGRKRKGLQAAYRRACALAEQGEVSQARRLYLELAATAQDVRLRALIANDRGPWRRPAAISRALGRGS
jgi:hypothetical protein